MLLRVALLRVALIDGRQPLPTRNGFEPEPEEAPPSVSDSVHLAGPTVKPIARARIGSHAGRYQLRQRSYRLPAVGLVGHQIGLVLGLC
jgi:hypothetical protein